MSNGYKKGPTQLVLEQARAIIKVVAGLNSKNKGKTVESVKNLLASITSAIPGVGSAKVEDDVSWTADWPDISFDGLSNDEIAQKQEDIQDYARQCLAAQDSRDGTNHSIRSFDWKEVTSSPLTYKLSVFLDPPAVLIEDGGPTGTISPTPPPPPRP